MKNLSLFTKSWQPDELQLDSFCELLAHYFVDFEETRETKLERALHFCPFTITMVGSLVVLSSMSSAPGDWIVSLAFADV
jgi:hypothetical protein